MFHRPVNLSLVLLVLLALVAPTAAGASQATAPGIEIKADQYGVPLATDPLVAQYGKPAVHLKVGDSVKFTVNIDGAGPYTVAFDLAATGTSINAPEAALLVDGATPVDAGRLILPNFYKNKAGSAPGDKFPQDRYGNDALIRQERLLQWTRVDVRDPNFGQAYPLQFNLAQGPHNFEFRLDRESILLGSAYIIPFAPYPNYQQYLTQHPAADASNVSIEMEAEFPAYKNDTSIRPINSRSLGVTPYDTYLLRLNALGGEKWQRSGSAVFYTVEVPVDGYYLVTLRALQDTRNNFTVFRRITVNGEAPFAELNAYPFHSTADWTNLTLGNGAPQSGGPYKIFLHQGANTLGIEATSSPYDKPIQKIQKVLVDINKLSLEIRKLTGNQVDQYKEWVISDYIPDIQPRLQAIAADLRVDLGTLQSLNPGGSSEAILNYQMAIDNIEALAKEPNKIPVRMNRFSEGSGSAAQLLGAALPLLQSQPLALDRIWVHSADRTPAEPQVSPVTSLTEGAKRFVHSFQPDPYLSIGAGAGEVEVWMNRPRQYVDLIQTLADDSFTPKTGIPVKVSIMPDESKLVLANAAGIAPDVALGVSTNQPYELAVRNALKDLRSFPDFDSFIRIYTPGSLLSYIINDSAYAIPETQDFWVTFYRRDIMQSLGLPVPKTWNEVIQELPTLQRLGMNYNTPLSSGAGVKGYLATSPYIFNYGAKLYSDDGFSSGLGTEQGIAAIRFMAQSFTIYGMPLTTSSFYNSFRYGETPIGVSNFTDYLKLLTAAPELNGLWGIDLYPATVLPDGTENRWATGSAQSCIMFANTDKPKESWEFMKWWMSTETQIDFQEQLLFSYGMEYLWSSANLEAFQASPMPEEHKKVALEQWKWLQEPQKLPGSYMEERELSNAWNRIVFDGVNPRSAIDSAVITINREITRKMEEFGYLQNGVKVKQYKVPTIETVRGWQENGTTQATNGK